MLVFRLSKQRVEIEYVVEQVERPLQHGGGAPHGVMPVHLAEHHVAGKHHHLGRRAPLSVIASPSPASLTHRLPISRC